MITLELKKFVSRNWTKAAADLFNMFLEEPDLYFKLSKSSRVRLVQHAHRKEKEQRQGREIKFPELLNYWTRYGSDAWTKIYYIKAKSKAQARYIMRQNNFSVDGFNTTPSAYDCTGETFAHSMEFTKVKGRCTVICSQRFYIDC
jgi:hypothetical protein